MHTNRLETENKQLHQVINQLRQVRKLNKGESDNAVSERDELKSLCAALQSEVTTLQHQVATLSANAQSVAYLKEELSSALVSLDAAEKSLEASRRQVAQLEKEAYDKESELEVTRSDILLIRQELEQRCVEVSNLKEAIHQVEAENSFGLSRFQRELAEKLEEVRRVSSLEKAELENRLSQQLQEQQLKCAKLEESNQDFELLHRKA